ncbi:MAG: tyrosine-type recombinase/integrase, partial [Candidatus Arsenophonus phytopathogenicus]
TDKVKPLTERIDGQGTVYFHEFLDRYEEILKTRGLRENTLKDYKQRIGVIRKGFLDTPIQNITTKNIADFLHDFIKDGKITTAKALRKSLIDIFKEALASGLMQTNPAELTKTPKIKIMRSRLSLHDFNTILKSIDDSHWLSHAMKLALITSQRISDISKMKWEDIYENKLWVVQQKTENKIAIPLNIEIENMKLDNILKNINRNSQFVISKSGKQLDAIKITVQFAKIRDKTNLSWDGNPPSFHEIRSLSARLYTKKMSGELAQKLLGHKSAEMTAKYQDERNIGWNEIIL